MGDIFLNGNKNGTLNGDCVCVWERNTVIDLKLFATHLLFLLMKFSLFVLIVQLILFLNCNNGFILPSFFYEESLWMNQTPICCRTRVVLYLLRKEFHICLVWTVEWKRQFDFECIGKLYKLNLLLKCYCKGKKGIPKCLSCVTVTGL